MAVALCFTLLRFTPLLDACTTVTDSLAAMTIVYAILGLALGATLGDLFGAVVGALLGVAFSQIHELRRSVAQVKRQQTELGDSLERAWKTPGASAPTRVGPERGATRAPSAEPALADSAKQESSDREELSQPRAESEPGVEARPPTAVEPAAAASPRPTPPVPVNPEARGPTRPGRLRSLLFGGNTVVRVGIVVLLVGVTLLVKYAAERDLFPVELRLISAAVMGLGLITLGLSLRGRKPGFSRTLQGGGVAAMYLVVFFAYRAYELLPAGLALVLLAGIAASSAVLAVLQSAMALIVVGQIGGFLAPILASTGSGKDVALFSYYLLLNLAIFGVALRRAWRPLNLIGFAFTFGIGTFWGVLDYEPEKLAATEPFLLAFFLLYVAIPIAYARRHETRGWVDGSLIFGTPLAFLALQLALVRDVPFAMAYTTLGMGGMYVVLARWLRRVSPESLHAMSEALLALGVGFGTLAVPYGLDDAGLTSATWALEGAGLYWVGARQHRARSRFAGVLLQALASVALIVHLDSGPRPQLPFANARMLAATFVMLGALLVARHAHAHRDELPRFEWGALQLLIATGLGFFIGVGLGEVHAHVPFDLRPGAALAFTGGTGVLLELVAAAVAWGPGRYPTASMIPLSLVAMLAWDAEVGEHLLSRGGFFGWPTWLACGVLSLRRFVPVAPAPLAALHAVALWATALFGALLLYRWLPGPAHLYGDWPISAFGVPLALASWLAVAGTRRGSWPFREHDGTYLGLGAGGLATGIVAWSLWLGGHATGDATPLPYVPLLHPADVAQAGGLLALVAWHRAAGHVELSLWPRAFVSRAPSVLAGTLFFWFNALLARSVHQYDGVPFQARALWRSVPLQVALSVSWAGIALGITAWASRRAHRASWFVGATLLAVVVLKLFLVDLSRLSAVAKIGTFLAVGVLLLIVGYLSPVPPAGAGAAEEAPR